MPGKGERADIEENEKICDEFGKAWEGAEGERYSWKAICFYKVEGGGECTPGEVTACVRVRHQEDMQTQARVRVYDLVSAARNTASRIYTCSLTYTLLYRTTQIKDNEYVNHQSQRKFTADHISSQSTPNP